MSEFYSLVLPWLVGAALMPLGLVRGWDLVTSIIDS